MCWLPARLTRCCCRCCCCCKQHLRLDNKSAGRQSVNSAQTKHGPESDTDSMAEYGDGETGKYKSLCGVVGGDGVNLSHVDILHTPCFIFVYLAGYPFLFCVSFCFSIISFSFVSFICFSFLFTYNHRAILVQKEWMRMDRLLDSTARRAVTRRPIQLPLPRWFR